ncbi:hypothetical protein COCOBI_18-2570 [Coccomyxa sp. Obi]|nr:hypothetical protein COCOBI_18-2570 [Coccomyxa sp. Obi]
MTRAGKIRQPKRPVRPKRPATSLTPRIVSVNKAESDTSIRKRCPQLPAEIWSLIAANMSTKEWVQISRTCKMFCRVEPAGPVCLEAGGKTGHNALTWLTQHTPSASSVAVNMDMAVDDVHRFIQQSGSISCSMDLRRLHIQAAPKVLDTSLVFQSWMEAYLQAHAYTLEVVSLRIWNLKTVPALLQLQHLMLATRKNLRQPILESFAHLPSLQSLWLGCDSLKQPDQPYEVDLRGCTNLQRVGFGTTLPKAFHVPPACLVAIDCTARAALNDRELWRDRSSFAEFLFDKCHDDVRWDRQLRTFLGEPELPAFPMLTQLHLHGKYIGSKQQPMVVDGNHLPVLRDLSIQCSIIVLSLEETCRLERLSLSVSFLIRMEVPNYKAVCSQLQYFRCYSTWKYVNAASFSIVRGIVNSGRFPPSPDGEPLMVLQRRYPIGFDGEPKRMGVIAFPRAALNDDVKSCRCQTCPACFGF